MEAGVAVRLDSVWKTYRMGDELVRALRGATLEVKKGEFFAIQGPSGSGKSTAMHIIGALDKPDKGTVSVMGRDVSLLSEDELAKLRGRTVGFVFQQFNLVPTLTALENVMLPMIFQGKQESERMEKATELLKASTSPALILGALAFSFILGCISGVAPARQAARLNPVQALRYE